MELYEHMIPDNISGFMALIGIILIFLFVVGQITEQRSGKDDDENGPKAA